MAKLNDTNEQGKLKPEEEIWPKEKQDTSNRIN